MLAFSKSNVSLYTPSISPFACDTVAEKIRGIRRVCCSSCCSSRPRHGALAQLPSSFPCRAFSCWTTSNLPSSEKECFGRLKQATSFLLLVV